MNRRLCGVTALLLAVLWFGNPAWAQHGAVDGEWPSYGGDLGSFQNLVLWTMSAMNQPGGLIENRGRWPLV